MGLVLPVIAGCMAGQPFAALRGPPAAIPNATDAPATDTEIAAPVDAAAPPMDPPAAPIAVAAPPAGTVPIVTPVRPARPAATIAFTPVIGAPPRVVQALSQGLSQSARADGLTIIESADKPSDHILKGYFSAFTDGDKTTVAFVWDVLGGDGKRVHRIRGQEIVQGTAPDPWATVQTATMEAIATRTIDAYLSWRAATGQSG